MTTKTSVPAGFTLDDLMAPVDTGERYRYGTKKEAEMLVDQMLPRPIHNVVNPIENTRAVGVNIIYEGRLRDGTPVRTVKTSYRTKGMIYYHSKMPADKPEEQSRAIEDFLRENYPREGDAVKVFWFSKGLLPDVWSDERFVYLNLEEEDRWELDGAVYVPPVFRMRRRQGPEKQKAEITGLEAKVVPEIVKVNWEILPPSEGEKRVRELYTQVAAARPTRYREVFDFFRANLVEVAVGVRGNSGYVAYVFPKHTILENVRLGNAIYVIPTDNWEELSKQEKPELRDNPRVVKMVHDAHTSWQHRVLQYLI